MSNERLTIIGAVLAVGPFILFMGFLCFDGMIQDWKQAIKYRHEDPFHLKMTIAVTLFIVSMFLGVGIMFYAAIFPTRT